jgi:hypothetical protein
MNEQHKKYLIGGLNKSLEDCHVKVSAAYLKSCGDDDTETINQCLKEWEQAGLLKIIKPYEECQPEDICVKMLNFIESGPPHDRFWDNPHLIRQMNED